MPTESKSSIPAVLNDGPQPNLRSQEFAEPAFEQGKLKPILPTPDLALPSDAEKTVEE